MEREGGREDQTVPLSIKKHYCDQTFPLSIKTLLGSDVSSFNKKNKKKQPKVSLGGLTQDQGGPDSTIMIEPCEGQSEGGGGPEMALGPGV